MRLATKIKSYQREGRPYRIACDAWADNYSYEFYAIVCHESNVKPIEYFHFIALCNDLDDLYYQ